MTETKQKLYEQKLIGSLIRFLDEIAIIQKVDWNDDKSPYIDLYAMPLNLHRALRQITYVIFKSEIEEFTNGKESISIILLSAQRKERKRDSNK